MRIKGYIKITGLFLMDYAILYYLCGLETALLITGIIAVYALWLGEYMAVFKGQGVRLDKVSGYEQEKLRRSFQQLTEDISNKTHFDAKRVKVYILPSDDINAFAYGFHHVSITRGALRAADDMTVNAIMAHEMSHILNLDAVVNRIVFANVTIIVGALAIASFMASAMLWIVFLVLCLFGLCGGVVSLFCVSGLSKLMKGVYSGAQRFVVFIYQVVMGIVSRRSEYRADAYAFDLGYGVQLEYFIQRFLVGQSYHPRTVREVLYDTHPLPEKRVEKLQNAGTQVKI